MNNLTLRQLRYFEALVRHGHFGRAADDCAVSQPALSVQIKALEETLGSPLFERGARHVRTTALGEEFVLRVREILRSVDELEDLARASRGKFAGRLRVGIIPTVAPYLLPVLIRRLAKTHADIDVHLRETVTSKLLRELEEGRLDTAIVALPVSENWLVETALFSEDFVLVRPTRERAEPPPDRERLAGMKLLLLEEGHCFRDQALSFCDLGASRPKEFLEGSSLSTLVQMVGAGVGVTLIPEMAIPVETRSAEVCIARFDDPKPSRTVGMVWRRTSPLADELKAVAEIVRDAGAALAG